MMGHLAWTAAVHWVAVRIVFSRFGVCCDATIALTPVRYDLTMARTLDLSQWAGHWVAVDTENRVRSDAATLAELLAAINAADFGEVEVMRAPAPDDPVVYGLG